MAFHMTVIQKENIHAWSTDSYAVYPLICQMWTIIT